MNKRIFITIVSALFLITFVSGTIVSEAATLSEIRQEISEKQKALNAGREQERSLSAQILELEKKLNELEAEIGKNEVKLAELEIELQKAQEKVDKQTDNLNGRLRNMYKTSSIGYLDVLLDSGSFSEFLTNIDLLKIVYSSDQEVLKELKAAKEEVEKKKEEVEALKAELEASKQETESAKKTIEAKKAEVAKSNKETEKMLNDLQRDADALTSQIQSSGSSSSTSTYTGGTFAWPTPSASYITSKFGYRTHPITGQRQSFHTGIDIGASSGSSIVSAADGTVIKASWYGGYGNCVIVDHGGGYSTLYAHCSRLYVSRGQSVSKGETIAAVGSTGNSTGPHLHYEIRINGNYVNPLNYYW